LRIKGVDKNKNCHFKIYLPVAGNNPCWSYYDCLINRPGRFPVSKFLDKLLRHAKINRTERNRFYLHVERDNRSQDIVNMDEDINAMLSLSP
jgi:hypothetical protein